MDDEQRDLYISIYIYVCIYVNVQAENTEVRYCEAHCFLFILTFIYIYLGLLCHDN